MTHLSISNDVVIVGAARTPVGAFKKSFATVPATKLGEIAIKAALERSGNLSAAEVDEVIMGQVLTAGCGMNPARQSSMNAGIPKEVPAWNINMVCGTGLKTVALAAQSIRTGERKIVVAGGQENMSLAPHTIGLRSAAFGMGDATMKDSMLQDGLTDAFHNIPMGITAENIAKKYNISREKQDLFSVESQNKAEHAQKQGWFNEEIVPVTIKNRTGDIIVSQDEYIRNGSTMEAMKKLKPCFVTDGTGTVTAGSSSGINDGAAAVVVMDASTASRKGLKPLAKIVSVGEAGVDPEMMGTGPIPASRIALQKAGWSIDSVDAFEFNEAFAAQAISVIQELGVDPFKVNIHGGSIAIGHPIGCSGTRVLITGIYALKRMLLENNPSNKASMRGLVSLCIGGGMGIAICIEVFA